MLDKKIYGFVTLGTKGQVVIPADAREALGLRSGDHLFVVGSESKGVLVLMPESSAIDFVDKINKKVEDFEEIRSKGPDAVEE